MIIIIIIYNYYLTIRPRCCPSRCGLFRSVQHKRVKFKVHCSLPNWFIISNTDIIKVIYSNVIIIINVRQILLSCQSKCLTTLSQIVVILKSCLPYFFGVWQNLKKWQIKCLATPHLIWKTLGKRYVSRYTHIISIYHNTLFVYRYLTLKLSSVHSWIFKNPIESSKYLSAWLLISAPPSLSTTGFIKHRGWGRGDV